MVIDITLAGLFWAMAGEDVMPRLIKKVLYVGAFAFIIGNFNFLAGVIFKSFAGLGLKASGASISSDQLLQPGRLAQVGVQAGQPMLTEIGKLAGFPNVFTNIDTVAVLFIAWIIVIVSFFVLAVQLFVSVLEFKLTTLAGFVLVPFALWGRTSFLAEKVLGNVVASGIKIMVLAVIVGIGTGLFSQFQTTAGDRSEHQPGAGHRTGQPVPARPWHLRAWHRHRPGVRGAPARCGRCSRSDRSRRRPADRGRCRSDGSRPAGRVVQRWAGRERRAASRRARAPPMARPPAPQARPAPGPWAPAWPASPARARRAPAMASAQLHNVRGAAVPPARRARHPVAAALPTRTPSQIGPATCVMASPCAAAWRRLCT